MLLIAAAPVAAAVTAPAAAAADLPLLPLLAVHPLALQAWQAEMARPITEKDRKELAKERPLLQYDSANNALWLRVKGRKNAGGCARDGGRWEGGRWEGGGGGGGGHRRRRGRAVKGERDGTG